MKDKVLTLTLKKRWFDMISSGVKTEEYREIKPFWMKRFCGKAPVIYRMALHLAIETDNFDVVSKTDITEFNKIQFTLGYPKADDMSRRIIFNNPHIRIGKGKPEWGAEPDKTYFVITWDDDR